MALVERLARVAAIDCCGCWALTDLVKQALDGGYQLRQGVLRDISDGHRIDRSVSVDQLVAECDNLRQVRDFRCQDWVKPRELIE